jgi:cell division protein FtsL
MAKRKNPFSRIRLVYRRSKPLTKMVVTVAIVLSMAALISLGIAKHAANQRVNELQQQTQALAQENEQLREDISQLGTLESIQKIAREVLDLVMPGTVFFNTGD